MAIYTILARSAEAEAIQDAHFLRDGFSRTAFWLGPIWLLRHGLYVAVAIWILAVALLSTAAATVLAPEAAFGIFVAIQILLGLEAEKLVEARLARNDFRLVDIVAARNLDEAEVTFFRRHAASAGPALAPEPRA